MSYDLSLEFILSGKPGRIMQLLTDPALIRRWSGGDAIVELKEGGQFQMFDGWVKGHVITAGKNELAYTWLSGDWPEGTKESKVKYVLQPHEQGTKVLLSHTQLPTEDEMKSHKSGWTDFFFDPLEDYILIIDKS